MIAANRAREALRSATRDCHGRVDEIYSAAQLSDPVSYGNFLRAQAAAYLPVEAALDDAEIASLIEDWPARARGPLLAGDLAELGIESPPPVGSPAFSGRAEMLGALYVLEGSRLGGKLLKRSVPAHLPTRFLGGGASASWQSLLSTMDNMLDTAQRIRRATGAARNVFSLFEDGGRRYLSGPAG